MEYLTTIEMSERWSITSRRIGVLCSEGRIDGAIKKGKTWLIPSDAVKPEDARKKKSFGVSERTIIYKEIAEKLYRNFVVNTDVAGVPQALSTKGFKYLTVKSPISISLIEEMLKGGYALGTYQQITNQNMLKWICFDFDCKEFESKKDLNILKKEYVDILIMLLEDMQIQYSLEYSGRRGIHVWIFFDQVISKDLGFTIVTKLRESFYFKIKSDNRFDLDCFPKTGSGKINNKYGLMIKIPLSRHKEGTYSYFKNKNEKKFEFIEQLTENFLNKQLKFLEDIRVNSVEDVIEKLKIEQKVSVDNLIKYHTKFLVGEHDITLNDIKIVFGTDEVLNTIWNRITDGKMSSIDRVIILGLFAHMESGEKILEEILKKQHNYNALISHNMIAKYKKYYFPITFNYLYELNDKVNYENEKGNVFIDEYIYTSLGIKYKISDIKKSRNISFVHNIVDKEINYFLYNDEVYNMFIWYQLNTLSYYDYCKIEEYINEVEKGNESVPDNVEYSKYIRKEKNKERLLISLGAQERVVTTALVNKMIMYLQKDYSSYSYHLNFGIGGDVFYPWISSWTRFINDVSQYFSFQLFENYSFIKIDIKGFYDNIYLQTMFKTIVDAHEGENYNKFINIYRYLNTFNERLMLDSTGDLRGVPQGPAYARVLAELVLDRIVSVFFSDNEKYQIVKYYRYVDDMFMFFPPEINGKNLINELSQHLESNGLYLNLDKTRNYGKIKDLTIDDRRELQEFKDLNYDIFNIKEKTWIDSVDKEEFNNIYIRYIYRKMSWDINDANIILSEKISNSVQERYLKEFYKEILTSEFGRGTLFRKYYKKIFAEPKLLNKFFKGKDYSLVPISSVNFENMLSILIMNLDDVFNMIDDIRYISELRDYLFEIDKTETISLLNNLINMKLEERGNEEC